MTGHNSDSFQSGIAAAMARGQAVKHEWVRSGEVVPVETLLNRWARTPSALATVAMCADLLAVEIGVTSYVPSEFLELDAEATSAICGALRGLDAMESLIFWKRVHGALGGQTILSELKRTRTMLCAPRCNLLSLIQHKREEVPAAHPDKSGKHCLLLPK